jgi:hypothetical protein
MIATKLNTKLRRARKSPAPGPMARKMNIAMMMAMPAILREFDPVIVLPVSLPALLRRHDPAIPKEINSAVLAAVVPETLTIFRAG